jgi:hypothetical protein
VPTLQLPTSLPQGRVSPVVQGQLSFSLPLQLASSPRTSQLSAASGSMLATHAVHFPSTHSRLPVAQLPTFVPQV